MRLLFFFLADVSVCLSVLQGVENEERRKEHVEHLLLELQEFADSHAIKNVVLCGDFNTQPFNVPKHDAQAVPTILHDKAASLCSAYPLPASQDEELFTTCKQRAGVMKVNYIDYIWHSAAISTTRTMQIPSLNEVVQTGLPCARYPSDHFSISAEMILHGFDQPQVVGGQSKHRSGARTSVVESMEKSRGRKSLGLDALIANAEAPPTFARGRKSLGLDQLCSQFQDESGVFLPSISLLVPSKGGLTDYSFFFSHAMYRFRFR
jgi:hypothetical protein